MTKRLHAVALVTAAGALLVVPTIGQADPSPNNPHNHGKAQGKGKGKGKAKTCAQQKTVNKGFVVKGTLKTDGYTADSAAEGDTTTVEFTVTGANRHARISEGFTDTEAGTPGFQFGSQTYIADANKDPFKLELSGYETGEAPKLGDKVRVIGKVPVTRKKCAAGQTLAQRVGAVENIRKVKIIDVDPDVAPTS